MKKHEKMRQILQNMPASIQDIRDAWQEVEAMGVQLMFRDWKEPQQLTADSVENGKVKSVICCTFDKDVPKEIQNFLAHAHSWMAHLMITIDGMSRVGEQFGKAKLRDRGLDGDTPLELRDIALDLRR